MRALLTGATSGIGEATAHRLAGLVDVLLVHGVEPEAERLVAALRGPEVVYLPADYGRLADVRALAAAAGERVDGLDLLINNAGRPGPPERTLSEDGIEVTFQANYLAAVALTTALRPRRVVNVASATHFSASLRLDDLELERSYSGVAAYAHSKLALVTYTCWLARRGVEAVSVHPGVISTGLLHAMFGAGGDPVERGARNVLHAAQAGGSGTYFDEGVPARPNPDALDPSNQDRLMAATDRYLADQPPSTGSVMPVT